MKLFEAKPQEVTEKAKRKLFSYIKANRIDKIQKLISTHKGILEEYYTDGTGGLNDSLVTGINGLQPIHVATILGRTDVIKFFVACDKDCLKRHCTNGLLAIHYAATSNNPDVIEVLSDCKADLNADVKNTEANTPLHLAAADDCYNAVKSLLKLHADRNKQNDRGQTPLDVARARRHRRIEAVLEEAHDDARYRLNVERLSSTSDEVQQRLERVESATKLQQCINSQVCERMDMLAKDVVQLSRGAQPSLTSADSCQSLGYRSMSGSLEWSQSVTALTEDTRPLGE